MSRSQLNLLVASPLEADQVARIRKAAGERIVVMHEPSLLPAIRYAADHNGIRPTLGAADEARWRSLLAQADISFDFDWWEPAKLPANAPRLRWVQATSAGIGDFLRRNDLLGTSIAFTTAAGVHAGPLAQFVLLGLLHFWREMPWLLRQQAGHRWQRFASGDLTGRRVLVIGLGGTGREVARMCAAVGLEVWGARRSANQPPPPGVSRLVDTRDLTSVLPQIDALVLACPLTAATLRMIGGQQIAALPSSALLVNIGRGGLIDEPALIAALREGRLAGAVLDVFEAEPLPPESPLWDMPNVIVSPHSASTVDTENRRIVDILIANIDRFLEGRPLINEFRREHGY